MEGTALQLTIHYYLDRENVNAMDAYTLNKCEAQLLEAIKHISGLIHTEIKVEACALEPGSVVSILKILGSSAVGTLLMTKTIDYIFNPDKTFLENTQTRMEIVEKMKTSNLSEEEAEALVAGDTRLERFASAYYRRLSEEASVVSVGTSVSGVSNDAQPLQPIQSTHIKKQDFARKMKDAATKTVSTERVAGTDIRIVAPVLLYDKKLKWRGRYNGDDIAFTIEDNDFLTQVHNKEVKFDSGTLIHCDLLVETTTYGDAAKKPSVSYRVELVHGWSDGEHMQMETKRYRKE